MKNHTIQCTKYNYAVPENYGSSNVLLRYDKEKDCLNIFNVNHLLNESTKDDGHVIKHSTRTLYKLDK